MKMPAFLLESGDELRTINDNIVQCLSTLKLQRNDIQQLIEKQENEKRRLTYEMEHINYKLTLIDRSLAQRLAARDKYDATIKETEENYKRIVECSGILLTSMQKEYTELIETMDKRVGTEAEEVSLKDFEFTFNEVSSRGDTLINVDDTFGKQSEGTETVSSKSVPKADVLSEPKSVTLSENSHDSNKVTGQSDNINPNVVITADTPKYFNEVHEISSGYLSSDHNRQPEDSNSSTIELLFKQSQASQKIDSFGSLKLIFSSDKTV